MVHYDGTQWTVVNSPNTPDLSNVLLGVSAVSSTSVWAVGDHSPAFGQSKTLVLHFDGTAWSISPSPSQAGSDSTVLFSASALPTGHVALGGTFTSLQLPPLRPFVLFTTQGR